MRRRNHRRRRRRRYHRRGHHLKYWALVLIGIVALIGAIAADVEPIRTYALNFSPEAVRLIDSVATVNQHVPVSPTELVPFPSNQQTVVPSQVPTAVPGAALPIRRPTRVPSVCLPAQIAKINAGGSTADPCYTLTPLPRSTTNQPPAIVSTPTQVAKTSAAENPAAPSHTPTPVPYPNLRHIEEKRYLLKQINDQRRIAGSVEVVLGDNIAAQLHAEAALENCFASHWGVDGLKPYMRYSLAGGYHSNAENAHGIDYCYSRRDGTSPIASIEEEVDDAMRGWIRSSGHLHTMIDGDHRKVNIGLAWNKYNFVAFAHFEGDYIEYSNLPTISREGVLSFSGTTKNGLTFRDSDDMSVQIYYDPPPHALTRGQLSRTYCVDGGILVGALREPLNDGASYREDEFTQRQKQCANPYDISPGAPVAASANQAVSNWRQTALTEKTTVASTVLWVTASEYRASGDAFSLTADIQTVLDRYGDGVYTVFVRGSVDGRRVPISEYSIFLGVEPPGTYIRQ